MKSLIWTLILVFSLVTIAGAESDDDKHQSLAQTICTYYGSAGANFQSKFNDAITYHMANFEEPKIANPTPKQIVNFLNRNKHKMTCGSGKNKKNYMMVAFDEDSHVSLFKKVFMRDYMKKDSSARIDVNAVSYTGADNTPETVIDYMDRTIEDLEKNPEISGSDKKYVKEVKGLRRFFVGKFGAKSFKDLPAAEQAKFRQ